MIRALRVAPRSMPAVAFLIVGAATTAVVRRDPGLSLAGDSAWGLCAELVAGGLAIVAATAIWRSHTVFPVLLAATALVFLMAEWNTPAAALAFTVGLVLFATWPALLAAAALRGLDERPIGRPAAVLLAVAFAAGTGLLGVASAVVFDPGAQGCERCPANALLLTDAPGLGHALKIGRAHV